MRVVIERFLRVDRVCALELDVVCRRGVTLVGLSIFAAARETVERLVDCVFEVGAEKSSQGGRAVADDREVPFEYCPEVDPESDPV
jgi:hypothetical protein